MKASIVFIITVAILCTTGVLFAFSGAPGYGFVIVAVTLCGMHIKADS